jgi:flagellar basal body-associated protein FliL
MAQAAPRTSQQRELAQTLMIGMSVLLIGSMIWAFNTLGKPWDAAGQRPMPTWFGINTVTSQMSDGHMLTVKLNLQLKGAEDSESLRPHEGAFKMLVQEVAAEMSRSELKEVDGIKHYGLALKDAMNGYLREQQRPERIKAVAFEDLVLMR